MIRLSTVLLASFLIAAPVKAETVLESTENIIRKDCIKKEYEPFSYGKGICIGYSHGMYTGYLSHQCLIFRLITRKEYEGVCLEIIDDFNNKTYDLPPYKNFYPDYLFMISEVFRDYLNSP